MNRSYTHKNYNYWTYDSGKPFDIRKNLDQKYQENFSPVSRTPQSFQNESIRTAEMIANSTNKPIALMMSGGGDSEAIARFFKQASIPFKAFTFRYNDGKNDHDIKYAIKWCENNQVENTLIDIDLDKIMKSNWAQETGNSLFIMYNYLLPYMWIIEYVANKGYLPIYGNGHLFELYKTKNGDWFCYYSEAWSTIFRYSILNGFEVNTNFHIYTPEQYLAFLNCPLIKKYTNGNHYEQLCIDTPKKDICYQMSNIKQLFFKSLFPDYEMRSKFTGFENIDFNGIDYNARTEHYNSNQHHYISLFHLKLMLEGN